MYLVDTDVIAEARKYPHAHPGVAAFLQEAQRKRTPIFVSAITIGEIRGAICAMRRRGGRTDPDALQAWLERLTRLYACRIISFDADTAMVYGSLRNASSVHPIDRQIGATALLHDLAVATRRTRGYAALGIRHLDLSSFRGTKISIIDTF